jgi:hypothetical protein
MRSVPFFTGAEIRPLVSWTVPLEWRLSPLQPGYVMTVWAEMREVRRERMVRARSGNDESGRIVNVRLRSDRGGVQYAGDVEISFQCSLGFVC